MGTKFPYVCIDTETTGLNYWPRGVDEIVEVTVKQFNKYGEYGECYTTLCRSKRGAIPAEATAIHGITDDDVKGKPNYLEDGVRDHVARLVGKKTVVGHNIKEFDLHFLMIKPVKVIDTLELSRMYFKGRHTLKAMCKKLKIKWDDGQSHRSEYDVDKNIELFIKLKEMINQHSERLDFFMAELKEISGVTLKDADINKIKNMTWSFSRLNLFHQCKLKWFYTYVQKVCESKKGYFTVGSTCHKIAEECGKWCHRDKFIKVMNAYLSNNDTDGFKIGEKIHSDFSAELYDNRGLISEKTPFKSFSELYNAIMSALKSSGCDIVGERMPGLEVFNDIVIKSKAKENCADPAMSKEVDIIMGLFYKTHDFTTLTGEVSLFEQKMAIDNDGNAVDFFDRASKLRGVADKIDFYGDSLIVTDYKSSRSMLSEDEMARDMQTKIYVYLVLKALGINSDNITGLSEVISRIDYIRFNKCVEYKVSGHDAIRRLLHEAETWVGATIESILKEAEKKENVFKPERNSFCTSCDIGELGYCNLYNNIAEGVKDIEQMLISTPQDCEKAWKQYEKNSIENRRLQSDCKNFMKMYDGPVSVDNTARLNFYVKEDEKYDLAKMIDVLTDNYDITLETIIAYASISKENFKKVMKKTRVDIKDEHKELFTKIVKKSEFKALTDDEIQSGGYINN